MTGVSGRSRVRIPALDGLRGIAILLMVFDHLLLLSLEMMPGTDLREFARRSVTRFAMPLFMIVSGFLLDQVSRRRMGQVVLAAGMVNLTLWLLWPSFALPEILAVWAFLLPVRAFLVRHPVEAAALGLLQAMYLPVHWPGYEPGIVLVFLALGRLWATRPGREDGLLSQIGTRVPGWVAALGRRPLLLYVGHLLPLAGLAGLFGAR